MLKSAAYNDIEISKDNGRSHINTNITHAYTFLLLFTQNRDLGQICDNSAYKR